MKDKDDEEEGEEEGDYDKRITTRATTRNAKRSMKIVKHVCIISVQQQQSRTPNNKIEKQHGYLAERSKPLVDLLKEARVIPYGTPTSLLCDLAYLESLD